MFRSPWELDAHVRYWNEHLASERQRSSQINRTNAGLARQLTQLRRRLGIGLIQIGTAIAGSDAPRGRPTPPAWPELAHR